MRAALACCFVVATACGAPEEARGTWAVPLIALAPHPDDLVTVATGLASQDRVAIAWGAYNAGELGVTASADEVVGLLDDGPMMRDVALDAIARLGLAVDATKLRAIHEDAVARGDDDRAMTAMAVAFRDPSRHRELITRGFDDALAKLDDHDWRWSRRLESFRAHANALASLRDTQLVATLVGMLETDIAVAVVSPGLAILRGACGCGGAYSTSCMGITVSGSLLPPRGVWRIDAADDADCVVLLPGPHDVCLARTERGNVYDTDDDGADVLTNDATDDDAAVAIDAEPESAAPEPVDEERRAACAPGDDGIQDEIAIGQSARNDELLGYLSSLIGEELHFDGMLTAVHVWRGETHYRSALHGMRERIRDEHTRIVGALAQAYLLPDGYRAPSIAITASVTDDRYCGVTSSLPTR